MAPASPASAPVTFADLWPGALRLCRRMGLKQILILSDAGRPIARFECRRDDELGGRIDHATEQRPGEPAATVALVLACGPRRIGR